MTRLSLTALLALAAAATLHAQSQLDPAARLLLQQQAQHAPAPSEAQSGEISVYVQIDPDAIDWQAIRDLGGRVGTIANTLATVRLPLTQLAALAQVPGIRYIQAPQHVMPMLDLARMEARADEAYSSLLTPDSSLPYTGQGIVIGQVDAGLDYQHNAFKTPDGELRIKRVWEQGTNPATASIYGLHSPEAFGYGAEFDTAELILKAGADSDADQGDNHHCQRHSADSVFLQKQKHVADEHHNDAGDDSLAVAPELISDEAADNRHEINGSEETAVQLSGSLGSQTEFRLQEQYENRKHCVVAEAFACVR